jgi:hypothetical protein
MVCRECRIAGMMSNVTILGGSTTLLGGNPFYDAEGVYHSHNLNVITQSYKCSNGHEFTKLSKQPCPVNGCKFNDDLPQNEEESGVTLNKLIAVCAKGHKGVDVYAFGMKKTGCMECFGEWMAANFPIEMKQVPVGEKIS